jgi:hypothetical protein
MYEKCIKDGKVAVLYSPGFGAGWSTWNSGDGVAEAMLFDKRIVELVEADKRGEITDELLEGWYDDDYVCVLGADDLDIAWLPIGTQFRVEEYDGSEYIITSDSLTYQA